MGQLEDFRASLKKKDSAVSSEGEIPVKGIAKAKQDKMKRRTHGLAVGNSSVQYISHNKSHVNPRTDMAN